MVVVLRIRCLLFLVMSLLAAALTAHAEIRWLETTFNYGLIKEDAGKAESRFRFVNDGDSAVVISRVRTTCGCTVARYTTDPVMPGDTAMVYVSYNPENRPGHFEKMIRVTTQPGDLVSRLFIQGAVMGTPTSLDASYPYKAGDLRLTQNQMIMGNMSFGKAAEATIYGYNQGRDTITLSAKAHSQALSTTFSHTSLPPGEIVAINVRFNSRMTESPGFFRECLSIASSSDAGEIPIDIYVTANVQSPSASLSAEKLSEAPRISVVPAIVDLGICKKSGKKAFEFVILNSGKEDLRIKRIYSRGGEIAIDSMPALLRAGGKGICKGTVDLVKAFGSQKAFGLKIEIVSNDPISPVYTIRLCGMAE